MRKSVSLSLRMLLAIPVLLGSILLIGIYSFLPPMLESLLARDLQTRLGLPSAPEVELDGDPPPEMLAGEFSGGRVLLQDATLGGVRPDRVAIDLDPFGVDVLRSAASGALRLEEPLSGRVRAEIPEGELTRIAGAGEYPVWGVSVEEGRMFVESEVEALGVVVPVSVVGEPEVRGTTLAFVPRRVRAAGAPVPEALSDELLAEAGFEYPLDDLPYGVRITDAETEEGRLVLSGAARNLPTGGQGWPPLITPFFPAIVCRGREVQEGDRRGGLEIPRA
jgi:LmeA-like phospholipid-binding